MSKIYVGDTGTEIRLNCRSDISTAANPVISVRKPDGTEAEWTAVREGNSLIYFVRDGDLSVPGIYKLQAVPHLEAWNGRGDTAVMQVYKKFE